MTSLKRKRPADERRPVYEFFCGSTEFSRFGDARRSSLPSTATDAELSAVRQRFFPSGYGLILKDAFPFLGRTIPVTRTDNHPSNGSTPFVRPRKAIARGIFGAAALLFLGAGAIPAAAQTAPFVDRNIRALEALAGKGSPRAQFELADRYENANGVKRDERMALSLYCRAARQDYADAAFRAGRMHMAGRGGVSRDEDLGRAWMRKAASLGSGEAEQVTKISTGAKVKGPDRCEPPNVRWGVIRKPPAEIRAMVTKMAPTYGLDPELVLAVIAVESGYRLDVVSNKNAMGLMQLIPETAERFGVTKPFDAEQNLRGGMKYLRWLLAYFDGNVTFALAGYNAGEGAVLQYKGVPPYRETQDYVVKIRSVYANSRHPFDSKVVQSAGLAAAKREEVAELSTVSTKTRGGGKR
ncbi:lytic transglycosylase [Azospirillum doebereinerae]|uniref:Lytic transglycosylase n=1 Tax=Azospirillum doebereinerae TaxID=92933 RepID=A0A3S0XKL6_9PROT|nr:lytic transglycosylase [Azospirillum doebereinerae]